MDIKKIINVPKEHRRTQQLNIKITPHQKTWLIQKKYSATSIFHECLKELGYKK